MSGDEGAFSEAARRAIMGHSTVAACWTYSLTRLRNLFSGSPGKLADRTRTLRSAVASWLTAVLARSLSLHTCVAVNTTNRPKTTPSGDRMPAEIALKDLIRLSVAAAITPA